MKTAKLAPCRAETVPLRQRSSWQPTYTIFPASGGAAIGDVGPCDGDREYALAFAAAPEMLETCEKLVRAAELLNPIMRSEMLEECGQCGCYHRPGYTGDCRNDAERWPTADPFEEAIEDARAAIAHATGQEA